MRSIIIFLSIIAIIGGCTAQVVSSKKLTESDYNKAFCNTILGNTEHILPDKTRVDCINDQYAIETDYANKWYEAIGQSLHYGLLTGKKPAIYLIQTEPIHKNHTERASNVIEHYKLPIKLFTANFSKE